MAQSHDMGRQGEILATQYLEETGCEVLETNWHSNHQEVDIIARQGDVLLIVEVKSRSTLYHGEPELFVTRNKQRMLVKAANHYVAWKDLDLEVRFDIITVHFRDDKQHELRHIKNAFYPAW